MNMTRETRDLPRIVVVGSLNLDLVCSGLPRFPTPGETMTGGRFATFPGGKGANQAFAAARLGAAVSMVGAVGEDRDGDYLRENLSRVGVDVEHVARCAEAASGVAVILVTEAGQNEIVLAPGANGAFSPSRLEASAARIGGARIVLLQLEIPLETVVVAAERASAAGALVILDPAPARPLPEALLACASYLTPNETELCALTGGGSLADEAGEEEAALVLAASRRARMLMGPGRAKRVLVKLGALGALLVTDEGEKRFAPVKVTAVDTTAAGDAFNAAFAVALLEGRSEDEAGAFACAAAAVSVTRAGAQPSMPTRAEVEAVRGGR
jgi:ribokinase